MFVHFGRMEIKKESNNSLTGSYIAKFMAYAILSLYNELCNTSYYEHGRHSDLYDFTDVGFGVGIGCRESVMVK